MDDSNLGEPITSEEESDPEIDEEEEEEERERKLLQKVMQQHGEHRGPIQTKETSGLAAPLSGISAKPKESLASRYYRNRNLTWSRDNPNGSNHGAPVICSSGGSKSGSNVRGSHSNRGGNAPLIPVRENYVCHICGEKGHHIRNCPHGNDPKKAKKVKPATGLPRSWLKRISDKDIARLECDIYSLPDGGFAVLEDNGPVSLPVEKKIVERFGVSSAAVIHDHLRCPICSGLFHDAVLVSCCGSTFCRSCILSKITSSAGGAATCPSCSDVVMENEFASNEAIQESVDAVLRVGRVDISSTNGISHRPSRPSELVAHQSVPPGTVREVKKVHGIVPVPLGGRVAGKRAAPPSSQLRFES